MPRIITTLLLCFLPVLSAPGWGIAVAEETRQFRSLFGFIVTDSPKVVDVSPNSPAAEAGLRVGDVIVAVNKKTIDRADQLMRAMDEIAPFTPTLLEVKRNGAQSVLSVVPIGWVRISPSPLQPVGLSIPGVPQQTPSQIPSTLPAPLDEINVLKQVIIDPRTREVSIIGVYDSNYATGPLPYLDLLKTAIKHPEPYFSLEREDQEQHSKWAASQAANPSNILVLNALILGHPGFQRESELYVGEVAKQYGISREEYVALFNFLTFENRDANISPELGRIQERALRHVGFAEAADDYSRLVRDREQAARSVLRDEEGLRPGGLLLQAYFAIAWKINVDAVRLSELERQVAGGIVSETHALTELQRLLLPEDTVRKDPTASVYWNGFTRLVISDKATRILNDVQGYAKPNCQSILVALRNDPHSQLNQFLYEADYALKSVSSLPELFSEIDGYLNEFQLRSAVGLSTPQFGRAWLAPDETSMNVSIDHSVISFGDAKMEVKSENLLRKGTPAYDDAAYQHINKNYDDYARRVPALHKVREVAKVIALAKWVKNNQIALDLRSVAQHPWTPPKKVRCLESSGVTLRSAKEGQYYRLAYRTDGGVDFRTERPWTKVTHAPEVKERLVEQVNASAYLGQQAVKAAQSGDLEKAKELARLSGESMTGAISGAELARRGISVPAASGGIEATAAQVEAQKQVLDLVSRAMAAPQTPETQDQLVQLGKSFEEIRASPDKASSILVGIRSDRLRRERTKAEPPKQEPAVASVESKAFRVGAVGGLMGEVWLTDPGIARRQASSGRSVHRGTKVETGPNGRIQILLLDATVFTIGPNSEMYIDEFVYDPKTDVSQKLTATVTKGVFRYVSGKIATREKEIVIKQPCCVGGIRGTDFISEISDLGTTATTVLSGQVEVTLVAKPAAPIIINAGSQITVQADGKTHHVQDVDSESIRLNWDKKYNFAPR